MKLLGKTACWLAMVLLAGCATLRERQEVPLVAAGSDTLFLREGDLLTQVRQDGGRGMAVLRAVTGGCEQAQVGRPTDVDVDEEGRVLVADGDLSCVLRLSPAGCSPRPYERFRLPEFATPTGVEAFPGGIAVADAGRAEVFVLGKGGLLKDRLRTPAGWLRPGQMHWDGERLYVVDAGRHQVHWFDGTGAYGGSLGGEGTGRGQLLHPVSVCVGPDRRVWVLDALNHRAQAYTRDGAADAAFGVYDHAPGGFMFPKGLAFDGDGNLYICDAGVNRVQVFSQSGALLYWFGATGRAEDQFLLPSAICADGNRLYITDQYNRRVQVFRYLPYLSAEAK